MLLQDLLLLMALVWQFQNSERDQVGGTCVVHACIPEKLMAYTASFSHVFEDADEYGWGKVQRRVSWQQFMTYSINFSSKSS